MFCATTFHIHCLSFYSHTLSLKHTLTHTHRGQVQSNLTQLADWPPTQTDQCCAIFGELLPLRAPISGVAYEMTGSLNVTSPTWPRLESV